MDEKSFRRGQSYVTLLTDLDEGRVLDVEEERTREAASGVADADPGAEKAGGGGAVDMWEPFVQTIQQEARRRPSCMTYHVSAYLNEAVDQVRRQEHKELLAPG